MSKFRFAMLLGAALTIASLALPLAAAVHPNHASSITSPQEGPPPDDGN
ncbi:MAG TPA: hypothetical protein VH639_13940 [Bryobacteraceae bacterium]